MGYVLYTLNVIIISFVGICAYPSAIGRRPSVSGGELWISNGNFAIICHAHIITLKEIHMARRIIKDPVFLAFVAVFFIVGFIYILLGIYPFGGNHVLRVDEFHSYAPELNELINKLKNGESLFFSWRGGLGVDFYFNVVVKMLNPLVLLGFIFGTEGITETFAVIHILYYYEI